MKIFIDLIIGLLLVYCINIGAEAEMQVIQIGKVLCSVPAEYKLSETNNSLYVNRSIIGISVIDVGRRGDGKLNELLHGEDVVVLASYLIGGVRIHEIQYDLGKRLSAKYFVLDEGQDYLTISNRDKEFVASWLDKCN